MQNTSSSLRTLGHPIRLATVEALANQECMVGDLNQRVNKALNTTISQSAFSQHLGQLREAGLVTTRRDRQMIIYKLNPAAFTGIQETLRTILMSEKISA